MSAIVQKLRYERTTDVRRMLKSAIIAEAIIKEVKRKFEGQEPETNLFDVLPAKAATSMRYERRATNAIAWDEDGKEEKIDLPLQDGWYLSDGNPFGVPNGRPSSYNDPNALYLFRQQDRSFNGSVGLGYWGGDYRGRDFYAVSDWSNVAGVALVTGREATAPLVEVPKEKLVGIVNPKDLLERAEQLEVMSNDFNQKFGGMCTAETNQRYVTEPLETAKMLRELAGKIQEAAKV